MKLNLKEASTVASLAQLLYEFLPGSGNNATAFPLAAQKVGVGEFWQPGSKSPALTRLLTLTLEHHRNLFCPLILEIVTQSMTWRGRREPLTRAEIDQLNTLLPGVGFKIPDLLDPAFLATLTGSPATPTPSPRNQPHAADPAKLAELAGQLRDLAALQPQERGYAFEKFLHALFDAYGLMSRASFKPRTGEQIDGSFELGADTYLLEAKWHNGLTPAADLHILNGKLSSRPTWSRGLFISYTGFSPDGLDAFSRGKTSLICMNGYDLHETLSRGLALDQVISRKARHAVETGHVCISVRELFP
ncbi:restriction endonuclease [Rhizobium sp. 1AS11]|uniref:restriction endonuclease n=1 Tax=Rhizobium acaciae TaxID=2989736 RepID=UPI002222D703|nr:restriction endonuclease [Rhizobium acaciae]MCW1411064.1 restriction endonuclease [Rhizobium acaciae]MCW1743084.1 restriction endonuclease [Rhizobium acaciae]